MIFIKNLFFIFGVFFFLIPFNYAKANDLETLNNYNNDILHGVEGMDITNNNVVTEVTDGDSNTFYNNGNDKPYYLLYDLKKPISRSSIISYESAFTYIQTNSTFTLVDTLGNDVQTYRLERRAIIKIPSDLDNQISSIRFKINVNGGGSKFNDFKLYYDPDLDLKLPNITDINYVESYNSVTFNWKNPDIDFENIIIKKNGDVLAELGKVQSFTASGLNSLTNYDFDFLVKYEDGTLSEPKSLSIKTLDAPPILNVSEISNLSFNETSSTVLFGWDNPPDTNFSHVKIYQDGTLIKDNLSNNVYLVENLDGNKTYVFKFVTVNTDGLESSGYIQSVKTKMEVDNQPPDIVKNVLTTPGNKSGRISWTSNVESDLAGYNVYIDGVQHNQALILSSNYVINNLENDTTYNIEVSAVDTSGNESVLSAAVPLTPLESAMPIFKNEYDLKNVSDGMSNWFIALWPILAFAVGLPLAFYIGQRMKGLFFA